MLRVKFLNFFYLLCVLHQRHTVMLILRWLYKYTDDCNSLTCYDSFSNMTVDFIWFAVFDLRLKGAAL